MDKEVLEILKQLVDGQKDTNSRLDRMEKKLDAVYDQTANLTEFRTEINAKIDTIQNDLNTVEVVTSKNWNDIAKLKAVK